jgi:hypothetical protein
MNSEYVSFARFSLPNRFRFVKQPLQDKEPAPGFQSRMAIVERTATRAEDQSCPN